MERYTGTKVVNATPMTRKEYNDFRNWDLPSNENGLDRGMLIEDINGVQNIEGFSGYVQWVTINEFNRIYNKRENLSFGEAVDKMKLGFKVARVGWNGKNMFLFLVDGSKFKVNRKPLLGIYKEGTEIIYQPHIDMKTADGSIVPWLSSQTDMLATDYLIVD